MSDEKYRAIYVLGNTNKGYIHKGNKKICFCYPKNNKAYNVPNSVNSDSINEKYNI